MSVDTNLHRTFDYQLSPAPLRIIDWAPIKSVAASVLQSGPNVKKYTVVDSVSANEAATAAAFAQQESVRREAARARVGRGPKNGSVNNEDPTSMVEHDVSVSPASSAAPVSALMAAQTDASVMAAASPYYTPGTAASGTSELMEVRAVDDALLQQQKHQQQQRQYAENWTGSSNGAASVSLSGAPFPTYGATHTPANATTAALIAAAPNGEAGAATITTATLLPVGDSSGMSVLAAGNVGGSSGTTATINNMNHSGNNSNNNNSSKFHLKNTGNTSHTSGHSGTATPKASAAVGATPRTRSPFTSSSLSASTPTLGRYNHQWGIASTMYGFDTVYQNGSFGVLLGLFTGVGYQQTNTFYRPEERVTERARGVFFFPTPVAGSAETGGAMGTATSGAGGPNPVSVSGCTNNCSPPESVATSPAAVAATGGDGSIDGVLGGGGSSGSAVAALTADELRSQRTRMGLVIAHKNNGGFQISNVIQCFWYWGAKRWTGVFNLRFTPLLSGDAILPVCECVVRSEITENSVLIDDPVVYLHSFVVMLGRRKRTPDDTLGATEAAARVGVDVTRGETGEASTPHPLAITAVETASKTDDEKSKGHITVRNKGTDARTAANGKCTLSTSEERTKTPSRPGEYSTAASAVAGGGALSPISPVESNRASSFLSQRRELDTQTTAQPSASVHGKKSPATPGSKSPAMRTSSALRTANSKAPLKSDGETDAATAVKTPSWYYWYQRCMMDTSDEWLWNRAAAEVAADVARSTTPWWRLRHVKTGVGLSYRYRKPRGINVYWGWSTQLGRGTALSGHVDVLRRMSCSISSSFGYLDLSVRLRANLVTLHQTALDAGLCWRPLPHVPEFAVRLATSANGTTLGVEIADVAPFVYAPLVERLAHSRARKRHANNVTGEEASVSEGGVAGAFESDENRNDALQSHANAAAGLSSTSMNPAASRLQYGSDGSQKEDFVGLLPVTWHYLRGFGTTIIHAYSNVAGAIASTWLSKSTVDAAQAAASVNAGTRGSATSMNTAVEVCHMPMPQLPTTPTITTVQTTPPLTSTSRLTNALVPLGRASMHCVSNAYRYVADLGWLETMLSTSHVNVSMGVTAEPGKLTRDWSFFLILSEK